VCTLKLSQDFRHRSCSCLIQVSLSPPSPSTQVLALTTHAVPAVRVRALKEMCPCRVKGDIARFWDRVLEMTHDEDPGTPCCSSCPERYIHLRGQTPSGLNLLVLGATVCSPLLMLSCVLRATAW
jgi:hypothetical protein